ncbi:MAG: adenylate/guanylate cyclase domain-containing protein [Gammaproteobacteria bacterium]|nr:MAG: adenylate/guanylate cyclase domain-containing protein [Gammaproteobacteria bacterium]
MDGVPQWLDRLGLGRFAAVFAEQQIDLEVLTELTDEDLEKLGIPLGPRKKLLKAIAELRDREPRSGSSASTRSAAERRHLTVMFCDLVGSTELSRRLDPEDLRQVNLDYQDACKAAIDAFDGFVARYMGDGVLAYFGYPQAHEDDAERAVRAGLGVVDAVSALKPQPDLRLQVRVGIATGLVVAGDLIGEGASSERAVVGETPNLAARLQGLAPPGGVVIAEATRRLVEGRFDAEALAATSLKGFDEPVVAFKVGAVQEKSRFEAATAGRLAKFVGRDSELQLLLERWRQAREGEGQVMLLSGEAGIGKSRILRELREGIREESPVTLQVQCSPYRINTAFSPVIDHLQQAADFRSGDGVEQKLDKLERLLSSAMDDISAAAPLIAALLTLPGDRYPPLDMAPLRQKMETIAVMAAYLEGVAARSPVLMLIEDLHWIDFSTLEALDALVSRAETLPVLMVMTHRPEFERRWTGHGHVTHHSLNRLRRGDGKTLAEHVTGGRALPDEILEQILERTDGIPLFVEELTKTVLEAGLLKESNGRYVLDGPLPPLAIPSTLHDSLMARLDRLAPVKEVAQAAACIGREFAPGLLSAALDRTAIEDDLQQLVEAELIFPRGAGEQTMYIFKHALVQDTAYKSLLLSKRQQLHSRIARTLEESTDADPAVLAHHFSAAGRAEKAAPNFLSAGRQGLAVTALAEACAQLELGLQETDKLDPSESRNRLELDIRTALGTGRIAHLGWPHPSVSDALVPAFDLARDLHHLEALASVLWGLWVHYQTRTEFPEAIRWLEILESIADETGDSELSVVRDMSGGCQYFWLAEYQRGDRYTARLRENYEQEKHGKVVAYANHDPLCFSLHWAGALLQWITGYPERSVADVEDSLNLARRLGHPFNLAFALTAGSDCLINLGDADRVFAHCEEAQAVVDEEGLGQFAQDLLVNNWLGRAYALREEYEIGYELTRLSNSHWDAAGGGICCARFWSTEAIELGGLGRRDEALQLIDRAIMHCRKTGDRWMEPEVLRVKGDLLLAGECPDTNAAEVAFNDSLQVARDHKAKSWELRAAMSLTKLWKSQGRESRAPELLIPIYEWFTEGFATADLRKAKALIESTS